MRYHEAQIAPEIFQEWIPPTNLKIPLCCV